MNWFRKRLSEKSTYVGLVTTILGVSTLVKFNEGEQIAATLDAASDPLSKGDYATGIGVILMGGLSMLMKEKK